MHPRLKENPRDWWKFLAGVCVALALAAWLMRRRGFIHGRMMWICLAMLALMLLAGAVRPLWIRPFYRGGMTVTFYVGQVASRILLTALFLIVVTPLGVLLRMLGKDLLALKRQPAARSFWQPVKTKPDLNRQF